ncbi:peptide chain release factor N(5)-glutamine methyltransferase [Magnetospira sp. QH-2]|uniref:peptide chain release factor N(5)-glutamine methyltransferase n=1 Tax=Magnetospira sp. (strain QH-2) TaxID=1288970 RepID=UPI0003E81AB4|nr:peptide chain release factor N(5)-glutamine methyltransferase [Magnetospira sp. QH-2]CCQ73194.1 N5-glutamine methyltransferase, modifies release factors RF-1 and RF-2 [Magnetospira sp. QH-2]
MTVGEALVEVVHRLAEANLEDPRLEGRLLVAWATGLRPETVFGYPEKTVSEEALERLRAAVERRAVRVPLAQITGEREFWSLPFKVTAETLIPRPDSETLVEAVLHLDLPSSPMILDLGTGTGCLLLCLLREWSAASGIGVEINPAAAAVAQDNARALHIANRAEIRIGDWTDVVAERFDLVISNPPYIPTGDIPDLQPDVRDHEPRRALDGGADGLDFYRRLARDMCSLLKPNAWLAVEVGQGQAESVVRLLNEAGLVGISAHNDLSGVPRCILGQWKSS